MPSMRALLALSLALLLPACTDKDEGTTADTETTTDAATDTAPTTGDADPPAADCECLPSDPCSVSLCPTLAYVEEENAELPADTEELAAAVTCALEALRDGKTGSIRWTAVYNAGQFESHGLLELFGAGTVRRSTGDVADLCYSESDDIVAGPLYPTEHFADCLAGTDLQGRFDCVVDALASTASVCQKGVQNCDGI